MYPYIMKCFEMPTVSDTPIEDFLFDDTTKIHLLGDSTLYNVVYFEFLSLAVPNLPVRTQNGLVYPISSN